jgi:hypothetical protein
MAGDQESQGNRSEFKRIGAFVGGALGIVAAIATIIGLLIQMHPFGTRTSAAPTPTVPALVDCGGKQQNFTVTKGDIPPQELTLALTIHGHQYRSPDGSARSQVTVDLRCDDNTVKLPRDDTVWCNGIRLKFNEPILGGPALYEGTVPAVAAGSSYTISYISGRGQTFSVSLNAMPEVVFTSPADGARIPTKSPLMIRYIPGGDTTYLISAIATDANGNSVSGASSDTRDSGSYLLGPLAAFAPGAGHITLTRLFKGSMIPIGGSPFGSVTAKYDEVGAVTVTWA